MAPPTAADNLVRIANAFVGVVGFSMMVYGGVLYTQWKEANAINGAAVGVGLLDFVMGTFMAAVGYRWKCFSQLYCACGSAAAPPPLFYVFPLSHPPPPHTHTHTTTPRTAALVMGILVCCEIPLAAIFFLPDQRDKILNQLLPVGSGDANAKVRSDIVAQATAIAWFLIALAALQALSLCLAFMQICRLTETFDERLYNDSASALLATRSPRGGNTFSDEEAPSAANRYKTKASSYYEKYGLK
jgi:hypothetical protein